MNVQSFSPGATKTLTVTSTSSSVSFTGGDIQSSQIRIANAGSVVMFVRWGVGAQTAVATDTPILAGTVEIFNKGNSDTVAAIGSTSGSMYVTAGEGM